MNNIIIYLAFIIACIFFYKIGTIVADFRNLKEESKGIDDLLEKANMEEDEYLRGTK